MDAVTLRVAQQVGIAVTAVALVFGIDVRGVEGQAHLLHPVLGADLGLESEIRGVVDHLVGEALGAQVEAQIGMGLFDVGEDVVPEGLDLRGLESGFVVHAELDSVDFGEDFEEAAQGGFGIRREVIGGDAPDEAGHALSGILRGAGNASALHAAAIDVVPDACRDFDTALVGQADQGSKGSGILGLLGLGQPDHFDVGKFLHVEEERVKGRHEAAVFVAEDDDEAVDPVGCQGVEVTLPVRFVIEAALEVSALHGVHGDAAFGEVGLLGGVADILEGVVGTPGNAVGGVEGGVHESAGVASAKGDRGLVLVAASPDGESLATGGEGRFPFLRGRRGPDAGEDDIVGLDGGGGDVEAFGAKRVLEFCQSVHGGRREFAFGEQGDLAGSYRGNGEQEERHKRGESAHAHSVCGFSLSNQTIL